MADQARPVIADRGWGSAHLYYPLGIRRKKANGCLAQEEENRPARVDDLLEGDELEQRLREDGRLEDILKDPELMPDWDAQFAQRQNAASR